MAGSVNKAVLIGNVGQKPEIRMTQSGSKIAQLSMATSESWKDKQTGERKENTQWHRVVCFNENIANVIENYVQKGSKIYVEGQIETRKWTDGNGVERYTTEIVIRPFKGELTLLDSNKGSGGPPPRENDEWSDQYQQGGQSPAHDADGVVHDDLEDEIPF